MMRIALLLVVLAAAAAGVATRGNELPAYADRTAEVAGRLWAGVEANPIPVGVALGTFLLAVVYHKARGKSLRESLAAAATRAALPPEEDPVVRRAKARATRAQLLADQIALQNRHRKLPAVVQAAEKETCYTEQAVADAERALADRKKAHAEALAKLDAVRAERFAAETELAEMDAALKKLADVV